jgi:hypothetical protein
MGVAIIRFLRYLRYVKNDQIENKLMKQLSMASICIATLGAIHASAIAQTANADIFANEYLFFNSLFTEDTGDNADIFANEYLFFNSLFTEDTGDNADIFANEYLFFNSLFTEDTGDNADIFANEYLFFNSLFTEDTGDNADIFANEYLFFNSLFTEDTGDNADLLIYGGDFFSFDEKESIFLVNWVDFDLSVITFFNSVIDGINFNPLMTKYTVSDADTLPYLPSSSTLLALVALGSLGLKYKKSKTAIGN